MQAADLLSGGTLERERDKLKVVVRLCEHFAHIVRVSKLHAYPTILFLTSGPTFDLQTTESSMNAALHANICYIGALFFLEGCESLGSSVLELDSFSLLVALTVSKGTSLKLDRNVVLASLLISLIQGGVKLYTGVQRHNLR